MGVYIKGVEMPKSCETCFAYERCNRQKYKWDIDKPVGCPLVPVPPHGRLIDADTCEDYFYEHLTDAGMVGAMNAIDEMPTIIPAEEGE